MRTRARARAARTASTSSANRKALTDAGQPSTCVTVNVRGRSGKYCVTDKGSLADVGSRSGFFELVEHASSPPANLYSLPAGATTQTLPGGSSIA